MFWDSVTSSTLTYQLEVVCKVALCDIRWVYLGALKYHLCRKGIRNVPFFPFNYHDRNKGFMHKQFPMDTLILEDFLFFYDEYNHKLLDILVFHVTSMSIVFDSPLGCGVHHDAGSLVPCIPRHSSLIHDL
ncbi:hypothetical protein HJG60_007849 [Phyllostomus discolor]|uniref:Uncharacterized protein n=1 Tax=Phyllostomus discolor TaxID=89673 RepID=A0A834BID7_9CHIR|nr:hypothetical protein HJG60_007849 [Phyllostomus discolor]